MLKADLHVHTEYSADPADALLKRFGTQESYTRVEEVYHEAKAQGMSFVTVTDHNVIGGALELTRNYPDDTFTGVELTAKFPEDGCSVHILVYDFTEAQFRELDRLRMDIYALRDYIRKEHLPYSVAHAIYSVNGHLSLAHIEKLILLFDVFECVNGARVETYNDLLKSVLRSLTPERVKGLQRQYDITPFSETPWQKAFTGGSDEHAGLFIGQSFTMAEGATREDFLRALREKRSDSGGRHNHYKTQVFTFLKIAYEASKAKRRRGLRLWDQLCAVVFDGRVPSWRVRLKLKLMRHSRRKKARVMAEKMSDLIMGLTRTPRPSLPKRIDAIYDVMASLEDAFFVLNADALRDAFHKKDVLKIMSALTALFRSVFLSLPFLGTFRHLYQSSAIMEEFRAYFLGPLKASERKVLWFTDTLHDLNGVSMVLKEIAKVAGRKGHTIRLVSAEPEGSVTSLEQLVLPVAYAYTPDFYSTFTLKFPSLLRSLEAVFVERPTEIMISTPGPVGLVGLLAARLFGVPCRGVYHSDFTRMTELGLSGGSLASFVKGYVRWFYSCMDEIRVPTCETIRQIAAEGYDEKRMKIFRRGIDLEVFASVTTGLAELRSRFGLDEAFTLLYSGRISKDKSVFFLADIYRALRRQGIEVNLLICGDGPELAALREEFKEDPRAKLTGSLPRQELPAVYSLADLMVFPSTMDTFGMAVLEAQACGLPVLVSNVGGPQELIVEERTGFIVPTMDVEDWVRAVLKVKMLGEKDPQALMAMKSAARENVKQRASWTEALKDLF